MAKANAQKFPPQVKYIVGNEGCERYSYYGMRSILTIFMVQVLLFQKEYATEVMHIFMGACYLFPIVGAYIADRFWGRYKTILYLSLFYCAGHAVLALFENEYGLYAGLTLIALGAGGIKPCVSAFVGDQFTADQKDMMSKVYSLFYWMINFGSTFSTIITPWTLKNYGPSVAFGIPGILMAIATVIFWLGTPKYVQTKPSGPDPEGFWPILLGGVFNNLKLGTGQTAVAFVGVAAIFAASIYALINSGITWMFIVPLAAIVFIVLAGYKSFWSRVEKNYSKKRIEEFKICLNIAKVFGMISIFWALFDQHASTWVLQAEKMDGHVDLGFWTFDVLSSQVSAVNPILVLTLIPVFVKWIYPAIDKVYKLTPLRKMSMGMIVASFGFIAVSIIQYKMDSLPAGEKLHMAWQVLPYLIMTTAEIMISITGLEFAYTQAPPSLKSTIMGFWFLTVFFGNVITAYLVHLSAFELGTGHFFMQFAVMMLLAAGAFAVIVKTYKPRDFLRE